MKFAILLSILSDLLSKRKTTAAYLAEKHGISPRTVYRYVEILSSAVPVCVKRGRDGGICLSDSYTLPMGFMTAEEYEAAIEALTTAYSERPEERFLEAKRKLSAQSKSESREAALSGSVEDILVRESLSDSIREKAQSFEECIRELAVTEIEYLDPLGKKIDCKIEPHVLVFKQNAWYVYAFSYKERDFRLFPLGRIRSVLKTEERFRKRPFDRDNIPLGEATAAKAIDIRLEISETALVKAQDRLGAENLRLKEGKWYADISLPDEEATVQKLLSFGTGVKVLSPPALRERIAAAAKAISNLYS